MKRVLLVLFFIVFTSNCYASGIPFELQTSSLFDVNGNDAYKVSIPVIDFDNDMTPDEYYYVIFNQVKKNRGTDRQADTIAVRKAAEYQASYEANNSGNRKTIQYWIYIKNQNGTATFSKVSVDLVNNRFRPLKGYALDNNDYIVKEYDDKEAWLSLNNSDIVKNSLDYLINNKIGVFSNLQ